MMGHGITTRVAGNAHGGNLVALGPGPSAKIAVPARLPETPWAAEMATGGTAGGLGQWMLAQPATNR
jgi:hypothetical protein